MSHEIEILQDGSAAFFSAREIPWHGLGQVVENALTAEEALSEARLDWSVSLQEMTSNVITEQGVTTIPVPDKFASVRTRANGEMDVLGVVGNRYTVLQNSEAFEFCNNIVDEGGAHFETAGSLYGGRRVFLSMKLPKDIVIGGQDLVENYIVVTNSHDGSSPVTVAVTPVRVVCKNTVTAALQQAVSTFKVRHSASVQGRLEEARQALRISWKYGDAFSQMANELYEQEMSAKEFDQYIARVFPLPKDGAEFKKQQTIWLNRRDELMGLWNADTQANIANTRWAAYNTIVEYVDWFAPVRGNENKDERRAERILDGSVQSIKDKALAILV